MVVIEGAGSPAEVNLRESDIVNMRVALHAQAPVLLVGDIDRGGVFASLLGTLELLQPEERALVKGLIINKFRGDVSLLGSGLRMLEERAGVPVLGVVPLPAGPADPRRTRWAWTASFRGPGLLDVAVIRLPRISNFDDFDLLAAEPQVGCATSTDPVAPRPARPGDPPRQQGHRGRPGLPARLGAGPLHPALAATGTPVLGICGGYQMMGERILDPEG